MGWAMLHHFATDLWYGIYATFRHVAPYIRDMPRE
jgi:hypothetical protein